jgi:hypothetical protein
MGEGGLERREMDSCFESPAIGGKRCFLLADGCKPVEKELSRFFSPAEYHVFQCSLATWLGTFALIFPVVHQNHLQNVFCQCCDTATCWGGVGPSNIFFYLGLYSVLWDLSLFCTPPHPHIWEKSKSCPVSLSLCSADAKIHACPKPVGQERVDEKFRSGLRSPSVQGWLLTCRK